jgi:hypothetical protein
VKEGPNGLRQLSRMELARRALDDETIKRVLINKDLLLTHRTKGTIQMVVRDLGNK